MISGILLAAGASRRFGKKNKLVENFKKKPLINHVLKSLIESKIDEIFIILGYQKKKIEKKILRHKKIKILYNKDYKKGISTSIKCGLKKISKNKKGFIIIHGDMPYIDYSIINKIYQSMNRLNKKIFIPKTKNKIGNPIGFAFSMKKEFYKIKGDIGAKKLILKNKKIIKFIKFKKDVIFKDIDQIIDIK